MSEVTKAPASKRRALHWVLMASLAVNLAVAGLALGAFVRGGPGGHDMGRNLGFGPYDAALLPEDRDRLRAAMRAKSGDLRSARAEAVTDMATVLSALRADPFDPAALDQALSQQMDHLSARMRLGSATMRDFLASLSPDERQAFADRLEDRMKRGRDMGERPPEK